MASLKQAVLLGLIVVSAVLAVLVGKRVSPDAAAMLIGFVAGFGASLPVGVVMAFWIAVPARRQPRDQEERPNPPVVVVTGGSSPQSAAGASTWTYPHPRRERHFVEDAWESDDPRT